MQLQMALMGFNKNKHSMQGHRCYGQATRVRRRVRDLFSKSCGQATVEFALVLFAFLALVAGLGSLCDFGRSGILAEHASAGASHTVGGSDAGAWADVLAY